jgi:predicted Zn-dependent protease with MMP-like domain
MTAPEETMWQDAQAPSLDAFEALAARAYRRLPSRFRALCDRLVIRVEEFPERKVLDELGIESEFDLLGLFSGVGLPQGPAVAETGSLPNVIHLYRRPILDYWTEHEETLGAIVTHVLVHEIGHHFGLSDGDIERIEAQADPSQADPSGTAR